MSVSKKIITYAILALTMTSNNTFTKIVIENASGKKIIINIDKKIGANWEVISPFDTITIDTTNKGSRGFYWTTVDNIKEFYQTPKYFFPDIITIKKDGLFDIKESLKEKKLDQKTEKPVDFATVKKSISEIEGAVKEAINIVPANPKSVELKITSDKTNFIEKEIKITNRAKSEIYVYIDCNYRIANNNGGYDRKTAAKKISKLGETGNISFFTYAPKGEEIAIRWTTNPDLKTANWYETQYKNYDDKKTVSIAILDDGKYEETIKLEATGIKITKIDGKEVGTTISETPKDTIKQANEIIFKQANQKTATQAQATQQR